MKINGLCLTGLCLLVFTPLVKGDFQERNGIQLPPDYNKIVAPSSGSSKNVITIGFEIHDVPEVNDMEYTVTLAMSIYAKWNDSRYSRNTYSNFQKQSNRGRVKVVMNNKIKKLTRDRLGLDPYCA
jgi:hypothetical protein